LGQSYKPLPSGIGFMTNYYQFTPELTIAISSKYKKYLRYFDSEYWFAKTKTSSQVGVELRIIDKLPKKSGPKIIHRYLKFKKLFWYEYVIDFSQQPIQIFVKNHLVALFYLKAFAPFVQTNVLEPIIYYQAIKNGYYFLHASTISRDNQAHCFIGRGGAGKTKTALNYCLNAHYAFMGDDLIFIENRTRSVYYFPRPLHLFSYNLFKIPKPTHFWPRFLYWRLFLIIKFKDLLRWLIRIFTKENPLISTRVDVRKLYPQMPLVQQAKLKEVTFLAGKVTDPLLEIISASDLRLDFMEIVQLLPKPTQISFLEQEKELLKHLFLKN
jgi:hypothetical protein